MNPELREGVGWGHFDQVALRPGLDLITTRFGIQGL